MFKLKQLTKSIIALAFFSLLLFPFGIKLLHHHNDLDNHNSCKEQKAHIHQKNLDCDFCYLYTAPLTTTNFYKYNFFEEVKTPSLLVFSFLKNYNHTYITYKQLRAPPYFYNS